MFDDLIDIFTRDLFAPLIPLFNDLFRGRSYNLFLSIFVATKRQIRQYLENNGIEIWWDVYDHERDTIIITVPEDQAERAKELLRAKGWIV